MWQFVKSVNGKKKQCYRGKVLETLCVNFVAKQIRGVIQIHLNFVMNVVKNLTCAKGAEEL